MTSLETATTSRFRSWNARLKVAVARTWSEGCAKCTHTRVLPVISFVAICQLRSGHEIWAIRSGKGATL